MSFWSVITDIFTSPAPPPPEPIIVEPVVPVVLPSFILADFEAISAALIYLRPLGAELIAFEKAWQDKSVQEEFLAGLPLIATIMKVVSIAFPQITLAEDGIALLSFVAPILVELLLKTGSGLIPDGQGGYVSKEWAADPRHLLNPDGSFKN